jgi:hypothetical protein
VGPLAGPLAAVPSGLVPAPVDSKMLALGWASIPALAGLRCLLNTVEGTRPLDSGRTERLDEKKQ